MSTDAPLIVVADSSAVVSLSLIEQLDILTVLFDDIAIPLAVWQELVEVGQLKNLPSLRTFFKDKVKKLQQANYLFPFVDYGESEAILLYKEIQAAYLIIDHKHAREVAEELGITCIGTLGILYRAKEKGLIQELRPLFLQLLKHERYYAKPPLNHLLKKANEALIL